MRWTTLGAAVLVTGMGASPARAQSGDEAAVMAVVEGMFDAMRAKDADALRALFTEDARLVSTGTDAEGRARARVVPMADFATNIGSATAYLDEQIWDEEVRIHDNLATVWVKYALFVDQQFSHCGVDAFQLFRGADGWKIFQIADTQRRQECWMPPS
ncbi:MAG: nuclear transport factor 2 family protein [Gemmatimonadota bacterium]|nr:nuclear transport factor 2 family protein [Gemmatimonadota bacterium]